MIKKKLEEKCMKDMKENDKAEMKWTKESENVALTEALSAAIRLASGL